MPIIKSAKKALRGSERKKVFNIRRKEAMRSSIKKVKNLVSEGKQEEAQKMMPEVYKSIDKAAKRGVIKKNNASRKKSRISALVQKTPAK